MNKPANEIQHDCQVVGGKASQRNCTPTLKIELCHLLFWLDGDTF